MKLVKCPHCADGFFLHLQMRSCLCGRTKGRYLNDEQAEVSEGAISIAIGNGSLETAVQDMRQLERNSAGLAHRDQYIEHARIWYAWVRPNSGNGNPHTRIIKE